MKATVALKEFMPAVTLAKRFVSDRALIPQLTQFYFAQDALHACADDAGCVLPLTWTVDEPFCVSASVHEQGQDTITLSRSAASLTVTATGFTARLPVTSGDDFPILSPPDPVGAPLPVIFWETLARTRFTICEDTTKPFLLGVHWSTTGALVSSDALRVSYARPRKDAPCSETGILIPSHLLSRLGARIQDVTHLHVQESALWALLPSGAVYGRLLAESFPIETASTRIQALRGRAKTGGTWVALHPSTCPLALILDRLLVFTDTLIPPIRVEVTPSLLRLRVEGEPGIPAVAEETLPCETRGPGGVLTINGRFLKEAWEAGLTRFWFSDTKTPIYFLSGDGYLEHLMMPLSE